MNHAHRKRGEADYRCFAGPIHFAKHPNPAAHGGVTRTERCRCGAIREININGRHREVGPWENWGTR